MKLSVRINDALTPGLTKAARSLENRRRPNRALSVKLYGWTIRNFNQSGGLAKPWVPLSPKTAKYKSEHGWSPKPLFRTGNLRNSFEGFYDNNVAGVGARASAGVNYAQVHQEGSAKRNIPARPMLPPEDVMRRFANEVYQLYIDDVARESGLK